MIVYISILILCKQMELIKHTITKQQYLISFAFL